MGISPHEFQSDSLPSPPTLVTHLPQRNRGGEGGGGGRGRGLGRGGNGGVKNKSNRLTGAWSILSDQPLKENWVLPHPTPPEAINSGELHVSILNTIVSFYILSVSRSLTTKQFPIRKKR